jgi:hypothetical protein
MAATKRTAAERIRVYGEFFPDIPFDAVIRHPLADEHDWLRAHHTRPEDCWSVDLNWALGDLAAFVQIIPITHRGGRSAG